MEDTRYLVASLMSDEQKATFEENGEIDFSYTMPGTGRFRVNIFRQRKSHAAAIRVIRTTIPTIDELMLPPILKDIAMSTNGLFLVTGHTGSGKSTSLAAIMRHINEYKSCHMITIEDPIEYVHPHGKAIVNQREVNDDTKSFTSALRASLREDPDVILVGEMRDLETISTAVTAAETGHFVMSTLHTSGAIQTIDRILDVFPPHQQQQIRAQLSMVLTGILSQHLIPKADDSGRVAAVELLIATDAVRNIIREGKTFQLETVMQTNIKNNMLPMDYSLAKLVRAGKITRQKALTFSHDPGTLERYMNAY
jgi:twitching motility protein PilT